MPRPEKVQAVAEIRERLEGAQAVFLAEYAGLSVKEQQALRRELRDTDAEFKVVKMTLARRAAAELEIDELDELLLGPTGIAYADGDPVSAAKALREFAKGHDVFAVKGGLLGREFLSPERITQLADVEPREVLLAKLAGAMKAPLANMAGLLAALPRNAATVLQQLLEAKEEADPEPEAVAAEPEPPEAPESEAAMEPEVVVEPEQAADEAAEAEAAVDEASPETEPEAAAVEPTSEDEGTEPESDAESDAEPVAEADADSDATESEIEASADAPADAAGAEAEDQSEAADQADEE
jgi:large subunit ribosomal protein L10